MELPIEIIIMIFALSLSMAVIATWKKIPFVMVIGGMLLTFTFILADSITALGDTQTCTTVRKTTTCTLEPHLLDMWIRIIFMILGTVFMMMGGLIWKSAE